MCDLGLLYWPLVICCKAKVTASCLTPLTIVLTFFELEIFDRAVQVLSAWQKLWSSSLRAAWFMRSWGQCCKTIFDTYNSHSRYFRLRKFDEGLDTGNLVIWFVLIFMVNFYTQHTHCNLAQSLLKWAVPASFFSFLHLSNIHFANDWIQTADLWSWKRLLYQLSHNYHPFMSNFDC